MGTTRKLSRATERKKPATMRMSGAPLRSKAPRNPPGEAGNGPAKNPQRTMRQAGALRASLNRSQTKGGAR